MTRVQANHLKQLTRANQRLYEPQLSRSQEVGMMLSRGGTQEQTRASPKAGRPCLILTCILHLSQWRIHSLKKNAFEGKDMGLCYAYTGWILAFLYLGEVIVYRHGEYKMCRRAPSARSSQWVSWRFSEWEGIIFFFKEKHKWEDEPVWAPIHLESCIQRFNHV